MYNDVHFSLNGPDPLNIRKIDMGALPMIHAMTKRGIYFDVDFIRKLDNKITTKQRELESGVPELIGNAYTDFHNDKRTPFSIGSPDHVARLLFKELQLAKPGEVKLTKGKTREAVDDDVLSMLESRHPVVKIISDWRELNKLHTTYTGPDCLASMVDSDSRIHTDFTVTVAATGRLSCVAVWTPIKTKRGTIPIGRIEVGDEVWTHKNRWRKVTRLIYKGVEKMYDVTLDNGNILTCTGSHRLLLSNDEHIKKVGGRSGQRGKNLETLQVGGVADDRTHSKRIGNHTTQRNVGMQKSHPGSGIQGPSNNPLFPLENRGTESDDGKERRETSQLDWASGRWIRVFDLFEGWQKAVCAQDNDGGGVRGESAPGDIRGASHRRQQKTQRTRQLRSRYRIWAQKNSLFTGEGQPLRYVKKIEPCGSLEVFDISVEEDESYEAYGIFHHNSRRPNLQNIPTRTELGKQVRYAFRASKGMVLVSCDLSQIEMRWAAHRSKDPTMMRVFWNREDVHTRTACNVFGLDYAAVMRIAQAVDNKTATPDQVKWYKAFKQEKRLPCKTVGFGVLYGQTAEGLQSSLVSEGVYWTLEECEDFITNKFFEVYVELKNMLERDYRFAIRYGLICDDFGRARLVPEAKSVHSWIREAGVRKAGNHPEQSGSQCGLKLGMAKVNDVLLPDFDNSVFALLQIHDELIFEAEPDYAEGFAQECSWMLERAVPLDVPVESSSDTAESWGELK